MDVTFPPGFPTLTGDVLSVNRFLASPLLIERALRTLTEQRFISDVIFEGRATPSGGAIVYEQNESIFPDEAVEAIEPGADFPISTVSRGPAKTANVRKWGIASQVTLEATKRLLMNPVNRALLKLANGVVRQVDTNAMSALLNSSPQTLAGSAWAVAAVNSNIIVQQIMTAISMIVGLNQGYEPDTLVINDMSKVDILANQQIALMMAREQLSNPIYTNQFPTKVLGLDVLVTNNVAGFADTVASGARTAFVLDRKVMGGMADEEPLSNVSWWIPAKESWQLQAKRVTVPWVMEPNAVVQITAV